MILNKLPAGFALPRALTRTYSMEFNSISVVLVMAMVLREHGTPDAVRKAAGRLRDKVCMEHRTIMARLMRMSDDAVVMTVARNIANRGTDAMGVLPGLQMWERQPDGSLVRGGVSKADVA